MTKHPQQGSDHSLDAVPGYIRLARGLEAGGFTNAARLFWALARSNELHTAYREPVPTRRADLVAAYEAALQGLQAGGAEPGLLQTLQAGLEAVRRDGTIPYSSIPPVYVCRECGALLLAIQPYACPHCGASALTLQSYPAVYWLEPLHPAVALDGLASAPAQFAARVAGLTEAQMARQPEPGEWGIRDTLYHLLVTHELLAGRVEKFLSEEHPSLAGVAAWAAEGAGQLSASEILLRYDSSRRALVEKLRPISLDTWWKEAWHEEFGTVTLLMQASYFVKHEQTHLPQIEHLRSLL